MSHASERLLLLVFISTVEGFTLRYAVDCSYSCDRTTACPNTAGCKRTVLDDCGCCHVCAAGRGEVCYRTVAGMDGVKCGPGLTCVFNSEEDDFGDEYGMCKDCPFGTYGLECRKVCKCLFGICNRVNGQCTKFLFSQIPEAKPGIRRKSASPSGNEQGSGFSNDDLKSTVLRDKTNSSIGDKRQPPR
ncbi:endothelial cell-specific molecule 1 [Leucoraja erinacea]|uniref:endothelial cell-specific molecule 1 n=1 Tax=Leucoraja erinaceus TaxID=7782 RepID=UPI002456D9DB|nr:endothelial cell-specific molecule 1 [Leucoraja erinacea]